MTAMVTNAAPQGYLSILLHAHLPFVRHPECAYMMEENWLYEGITETYIPLLAYFDNLVSDGVPFRITMSLTPTLCAMLADELLQDRYVNRINTLIELAEKEIVRTRYDKTANRTAMMYLERFTLCKHIFEDRYDRNIITGYKNLQDADHLEIVTCAATHGYLPNMQSNVNAVRAQIAVAAQSYNNFFGKSPRGIWLPECGYYRGLESILNQYGIKYFFTEAHGILHAAPAPYHGVLAPVKCAAAPVAAFGRDVESSKSVWSADEGYPGDPNYREFHKDIGHDLDMRYVAPYIDPAGIRLHTGIKYHRVTNKHDPNKKLYDRELALSRAAVHASDFLRKRAAQIAQASSRMNKPPLITAPYDAELFGHWWFEGPEWLNFLIRECALDPNAPRLITPSEYLNIYPPEHLCAPAFSSWGDGGYSEMWLNETNEWIYPHLHRMEDRMVEIAREFQSVNSIDGNSNVNSCGNVNNTNGNNDVCNVNSNNNINNNNILPRTLNQMSRELLLAQSSDWAFIMKTGTTVEYADRRVKEHIASFWKLHDMVRENNIDPDFVLLLESHNNIFQDIDFRIYC